MYLYAFVEVPPAALPAGIGGEALRLVELRGVLAVVSDRASVPAVTEAALRAHDEVVRRLCAAAGGALPARFGSALPDESALDEAVRPRLEQLREALRLVRGCEQMTLRVFAEATEAAPDPTHAESAAPGTRWLAARAPRQRLLARVPDLAPVLRLLAPLVAAERIEVHDAAPLQGTVSHLVRVADLAGYRRALTRAEAAAPALRIVESGPWPPYAFADGMP